MTKDIFSDVQIYIYNQNPFKNISIKSGFVMTSIKFTKLEFSWEIWDIWSSLYIESTEKKKPHQSSFIHLFSNALHGPTVVSLLFLKHSLLKDLGLLFLLEGSSPMTHFIHISAQLPPAQRGLSWSFCLKDQPSSHFLSALFFSTIFITTF